MTYTRPIIMTTIDFLRLFFDEYSEIRVKNGTCFLAGNNNPEGMYFLIRGYVRQYAKKADGSILYLHIYKPGSCFPLMWLFNETSNKYYYEALTDIVLKVAPSSDVKRFIGKHPEIVEQFVSRLLLGLDGLLSRMESLVLDSAYRKTVLLFLYLATSFGKKSQKTITLDIPLTHREIADWIGTARETASITTESLKRKHIIRYRGKHYDILDIHALTKELEKDI